MWSMRTEDFAHRAISHQSFPSSLKKKSIVVWSCTHKKIFGYQIAKSYLRRWECLRLDTAAAFGGEKSRGGGRHLMPWNFSHVHEIPANGSTEKMGSVKFQQFLFRENDRSYALRCYADIVVAGNLIMAFAFSRILQSKQNDKDNLLFFKLSFCYVFKLIFVQGSAKILR